MFFRAFKSIHIRSKTMLPTAFSHKCQSLMISVVDLQGPVPPTTQVLQLLQQTEEWPCRLSWVPATATQHLNYPYFFTSPKSQENKSGKLNQWDMYIYIYCTWCVCSARPQSHYVVGTNQDSPAFDSWKWGLKMGYPVIAWWLIIIH